MKILGIVLLARNGRVSKTLCSAMDLTSFNYFQRGSMKEFVLFVSKTLAERTQPGTRHTVKEQKSVCHVHVRNDGLVGVVVCDEEYPQRVAFSLIAKAFEGLQEKYPGRNLTEAQENSVVYDDLEALMTRYQDPTQADPMMQVQKEIDETKVILHGTLESMLERGEKLENLVERSDALSMQSKMFYKSAKKTNSCCTFM
eukprot:Clim_evm38s204 gene=Clim_evmTU38s204